MADVTFDGTDVGSNPIEFEPLVGKNPAVFTTLSGLNTYQYSSETHATGPKHIERKMVFGTNKANTDVLLALQGTQVTFNDQGHFGGYYSDVEIFVTRVVPKTFWAVHSDSSKHLWTVELYFVVV